LLYLLNLLKFRSSFFAKDVLFREVAAMPRITSLEMQQRRRKRYSLFVDNEFFAGVDQEVVALLKLKPGQDVQPDDLRRVLEQEEEIRARELCLRWLAVAPRTRQQLADRLRRKDVSAEAANNTLDRLQAAGLVNDEAYARDWVKTHTAAGAMGRSRLSAELARRGVPRSAADEVIKGEAPADEAVACAALARRMVARYARLPNSVARRRLAGYLARRGFDAEAVRAAVNAELPEER
jgi:regulatory protein